MAETMVSTGVRPSARRHFLGMRVSTGHIALTILLLATACCVFSVPATADDAEDYVFGTSLVISSPSRIGDDWVDQLPSQYSYSIGSIVDAVNEARAARGVSQMVDVKSYPVFIGNEMQRGSQWEYNITFQWMTPEDVAVVLAKYPFTGKFAGAATAYRPLDSASFNSTQSADGMSATLDLLGTQITAGFDDTFSSVRSQVESILAQRFGDRAKFDLSLDDYISAGGTYPNSVGFSVTVYLNGAEKQALADAEGEPQAP